MILPKHHGPGSFLFKDTASLIETALGKRFPDLVVKGASLFNVYTGEIFENTCISVSKKHIAHVGLGDDFTPGPDTRIIDAGGAAVIPGFIDGHAHLAWLAPPDQLLGAMAGSGTTTIITETMELFPIAGKAGVEAFLTALQHQPVKCFGTAPAMASISRNTIGMPLADLASLLKRDDIIGMGESYWQVVLQNPDLFLPGYEMTLASGKTLEGHSAGARARKLSAYLGLGISSCHEPIDEAQVIERLRCGIHVMIREGSIRSDLKEISGIRNRGLDLRYLCLVSDGVTPQSLLENGHMETIVQTAIHAGFDPMDAVRMATLNVAEHFGLAGQIGGIAPGRYADMLIVPDIKEGKPSCVISSGRVVAEEGVLMEAPRKHDFGRQAKTSVRLPGPVKPSDFIIPVPDSGDRTTVRIIHQVTDLVTQENITTLNPVDGRVIQDISRDILKVAAIDRAICPGKLFTGLISGFGIKRGAVASTGAWDTPDIIVVGADDRDMALAVNRIHELQGGAVVTAGGTILAEIPLPVFGLFSERSLREVAKETSAVTRAVQNLGSQFPDPLLTLVTLTGAAIPYLRICEEGLVNLKEGKTLGLFV